MALALFRHVQIGFQGHSSIPPDVHDSGIVAGASHSMSVAHLPALTEDFHPESTAPPTKSSRAESTVEALSLIRGV